MDKKRRFSLPGVGVSSLLTIFAVLCLGVFAVLSVSTAQADRRLADESFSAALDYYKAEGLAHETLARLRAGEMPEGVRETDGVYSYACTISDSLSLVVEAEIQDSEFTILRWQAVNTARWQADDELHLWDGAEER